MLRSLTPLRVACLSFILLLPSLALANDPGIPDTVALEVVDLPPASGDSVFAVEVWLFNDSMVRSIAVPIEWSGTDVRLDSAVAEPIFLQVFDFIAEIYYQGSIDVSNDTSLVRLGGTSFLPTTGLAGASARRLMATYYFTWTANDSEQASFDKVDGLGPLDYIFVTAQTTGYEPIFVPTVATPTSDEINPRIDDLSNQAAYIGAHFFATVTTADAPLSDEAWGEPVLWLANGADSIRLYQTEQIDPYQINCWGFVPHDVSTGSWDLHLIARPGAPGLTRSAAVQIDPLPGYSPASSVAPSRVVEYCKVSNFALQTLEPLPAATFVIVHDDGVLIDTAEVTGYTLSRANSIELSFLAPAVNDDSVALDFSFFTDDRSLLYQADNVAWCIRQPQVASIRPDTVYYLDTNSLILTLDQPLVHYLQPQSATLRADGTEFGDYVGSQIQALNDSQFVMQFRVEDPVTHQLYEDEYHPLLELRFDPGVTDVPLYQYLTVFQRNGSNPIDPVLDSTLAGEDIPDAEFELAQNYPNPFNPETQISYNLPEASDVRIDLYNVLGQRVATLVDEYRGAGAHVVSFNPGHLSSPMASGMYFYRITAGSFVETKQMVYLK